MLFFALSNRAPGRVHNEVMTCGKFNGMHLFCRCIFTNIDPVTGQRNPKHQPYTKLKEYRRIAANEQLPVMGVHIGLRDPGRITIGDPIYVEDNDEWIETITH